MDIESGKTLRTFDIPYVCALCYHESTDSLLVGRCLERTDSGYFKPGSRVLEQYCATTGGFVSLLATGLHWPRDMSFTATGELALADIITVKVFQIQVI